MHTIGAVLFYKEPVQMWVEYPLSAPQTHTHMHGALNTPQDMSIWDEQMMKTSFHSEMKTQADTCLFNFVIKVMAHPVWGIKLYVWRKIILI